jgi:predicted secreted hydrolase
MPATGARRFRHLVLALVMSGCGADVAPNPRGAALQVGDLLGGADTLHARASAPRTFTFPADHGPHPEFRTEWWYFTGNVTATDGREFGYQLTFFRSALADSAAFLARHAAADPAGGAAVDTDTPAAGTSAWRTRHAYMAHFAVSDIGASRFHAAERFARDAVGLAGAEAQPFRVHLDAWSAASEGTGTFPLRLVAANGDVAIDLVLEQGKPHVLQGDAGLSRKGPEPGNASYYYAYTRMPTRGTVRVGGTSHDVSGASWLDREWSTSALSPDLAGWDWMALQLDDGTDLMLYHLRRDDGGAGPFSAGSLVASDGTRTGLDAGEFSMQPTRHWQSPLDDTRWPVAWRVAVPSLALELEVSAAFDAQELDLAVRYWEGSVRVRGERAGRAVRGRGYLEMTGY